MVAHAAVHLEEEKKTPSDNNLEHGSFGRKYVSFFKTNYLEPSFMMKFYDETVGTDGAEVKDFVERRVLKDG